MKYPNLAEGERVLYKTGRHYRYYWIPICLGIIFTNVWVGLGIPFAVYLYLRFKKDRILITNNRVLIIEGLKEKVVYEAALADIRSVEYSYNYWARSHNITFVLESGPTKFSFISGALSFKEALEKVLGRSQ